MVREQATVSQRVRFVVFDRDNFTCQYCGLKAPNVALEVDHVIPVSKGGTNDISNLVTSCLDCNRGKGARELSSKRSPDWKDRQLEELRKRCARMESLLDKTREEISKRNKPDWEIFTVHQARVYAGLSQDAMADCLRISRSTYRRYEYRPMFMPQEVLARFSKITNIPIEDIIIQRQEEEEGRLDEST